ncbi:glutaminyl-peptide cyclotransferase [Pedobacter sp. LMG 31464]|uniref:Glutaminyl-peptide cyclotransferase n=1 Tax=Pedobacter planticolens TaxID=2679964 RepID=A0A923IW15_9SPHI|nr:glutaminyl-peptide cyclotransferase [Pedobacter planticolens]MBB2146626.1 glutaminyl-peptide cyclotransferase [Pedobacter planticolens]
MHSGLKINQIKNILFIAIIVAFASSCKNSSTSYRSFISPELGQNVPLGNEFEVKILFGKEKKVDSVVYLIDTTKVGSKADTTAIKLKTEGLKLGGHLLTAKIYGDGEPEEVTANINVLAAKAPIEYTYKVINTLPHDTSSYVEGLEYHDGFFYESAGDYGHSSLRKVEPSTGKIVQSTPVDKKYFAEGITVIGDKIIQLTYQEKVGFVYDKATLKKLSEFAYLTGKEGWGLAFDGQKVLNTDGSNTIFFLDKNNYNRIGSIDVYDNKEPIESLNELEYIDGKIYANVYTTDTILIINPINGAVEGRINLKGIFPAGDYFKTGDERRNNVLNGIAWDAKGKRLFVTGKKWPKIYEIKIVESSAK